LELADVVKSLRLHWRVSVAIVLLAGFFFAAFLVTRNQVRPADRYEVGIQILVPTREKGKRPANVPPQLLQGQSTKALAQSTKDAALKAAKIPEDERSSIGFRYSASESGDIITLTAVANDADVAKKVAQAYRSAYVATRRAAVASGLDGAAKGAKETLGTLLRRLAQVRKALREADPDLFATLPISPVATGDDIISRLPVLSTPLETILLVTEHQSLLAGILSSEKAYAEASRGARTSSGFATTVETNQSRQITPELPSPVVPAAVFLAIGVALALVAPILMDRLDHSIRTAKTAAIAFDSVVLTSIPSASRKVQRALVAPGTPWDGAYRALAATSIATDRLPRAILVTSPTGTVQDTVAANFAAALAGLGLRVVLIGTDARQTWFLDTAAEPTESRLSFPELLEMAHQGRLDGALPRVLLPTSLDNLLVMPPGTGEREVSLDGLGPLLEALSTSGVDVTVIAGPALLEDPNATILAWITRSVLWAFETGDVTEAEAKEAASRLALAGASSFGVAMVNAKT
jgi:Mrp family chromosome partitioning ATPase